MADIAKKEAWPFSKKPVESAKAIKLSIFPQASLARETSRTAKGKKYRSGNHTPLNTPLFWRAAIRQKAATAVRDTPNPLVNRRKIATSRVIQKEL